MVICLQVYSAGGEAAKSVDLLWRLAEACYRKGNETDNNEQRKKLILEGEPLTLQSRPEGMLCQCVSVSVCVCVCVRHYHLINHLVSSRS